VTIPCSGSDEGIAELGLEFDEAEKFNREKVEVERDASLARADQATTRQSGAN